jgi:hypothetical protein
MLPVRQLRRRDPVLGRSFRQLEKDVSRLCVSRKDLRAASLPVTSFSGSFTGFRKPFFTPQSQCGRLQTLICLRRGAFHRGYHALKSGLSHGV